LPFSFLPESKYNVETKTISADFGSVDIYTKIESGLTGLEIGVLGKLYLCYISDTIWLGCLSFHSGTVCSGLKQQNFFNDQLCLVTL